MNRSCLCAMMLCLLAACQESLVQGLSEREANEILVVLGEEGIAAEKQVQRGGGFSVWVASDLSFDALQVLTAEHLPRSPRVSSESSSLLPSPAAEQQQRLSEKLSSLEASLLSVPRVLEAKLEVAAEPWPSKSGVRSASLLYRYRGELPMKEEVLRRFVAASLGITETEKIAVLAIQEPPRLSREAPETVAMLGVLPAYAWRLRFVLLSGGFLLFSLLCALVFLLLRRRKKEA